MFLQDSAYVSLLPVWRLARIVCDVYLDELTCKCQAKFEWNTCSLIRTLPLFYLIRTGFLNVYVGRNRPGGAQL